MTRDQIIEKVKAVLDELSPFENTELNPGIELIDKLLDDSSNEVRMICPLYLLSPTTISDDPIPDGRIGYIPLQDDFLRLHSLRMKGWKRTVTNAITDENPISRLQDNEYTMGGTVKPIAIIRREEGELRLYYYSLPEGEQHVRQVSKYIKRDKAENLPEACIDILSWYTALNVSMAIGETGKAEVAKSKITELIKMKT